MQPQPAKEPYEQPWELASRDAIQAFRRADGEVVIEVKGKKSAVCYVVRIQPDLQDIARSSPQFQLEGHRVGECPELVTSITYEYHQSFSVDPKVQAICVEHNDGTDTVPIQQNLTAVGYSDAFDLKEAFENAVKQIAPLARPRADMPLRVVATSIGGDFGGYDANKRVLFVEIKDISA